MNDRYEFDALGSLASCGVAHIEICCLQLPGVHRDSVAIGPPIERVGAAATLIMIARRARCRFCRRRGAHVLPQRPPVPGTPDFDPALDVFPDLLSVIIYSYI